MADFGVRLGDAALDDISALLRARTKDPAPPAKEATPPPAKAPPPVPVAIAPRDEDKPRWTELGESAKDLGLEMRATRGRTIAERTAARLELAIRKLGRG